MAGLLKKHNEKIEKIKDSRAFKILRIVKNVVFGVLLAFLVCVVVATLTARINGETPHLFGHAIYRVSSGSMQPNLMIGDIILVSDCDPMKLKKDDIITYDGKNGQFAGKKVTHRVVKEPYLNEEDGNYYLVTKGDDNPVEDTPILTSQVTGKFVQKVEIVKNLYNFFITPWGLLTLIGLIVLAFFNEIIIFVKAVRGIDDEEQEDIQEIIERVQRESAEEQNKERDDKAEQ